MRYGMLVPVDYERLAEFLLHRSTDVNNPLDLKFESIRDYLEKSTSAMLTNPDTRYEEIEDSDLTKLLLEEYSFGIIDEVVITSSPGIVVPVDGHLLKLPLVLIKI